MTGDAMRRVTRGDRLEISAAAWNEVREATAALRGRRFDLGTDDRRAIWDTGIVLAQNETGADLQRTDVVGLVDLVGVDQGDGAEKKRRILQRPVFAAATPDIADHLGRWGVTFEPIRQHEVGRVYVSGVFPAWIDLLDHDHCYCDLRAEAPTRDALESRADGAGLILWRDDDDGESLGEMLALIHVGPYPRPTWQYATLTEDLVSGGSVEARLLVQSSETGLLDTSERFIECYAPLVRAGWYLPAGTIGKVEVQPRSGLWNMTSVDRCPLPWEGS